MPAYEGRISDWSSDVFSSDLVVGAHRAFHRVQPPVLIGLVGRLGHVEPGPQALGAGAVARPALERAAQRRPAVDIAVLGHPVVAARQYRRASCWVRVWWYVLLSLFACS